MTIASNDAFVSGPYAGDGVTTVFDYDFKIYADTELLITRTNADASTTALALTTDYTVAGVGDTGGGTITLVAGSRLPAGALMTIEPNVTLSQERPFGSQTSTSLQELEDALDKLTSLSRQVAGLLARAPQVAAGQTAGRMVAGAASTLALHDGAGGLAEGRTLTALDADITAVAADRVQTGLDRAQTTADRAQTMDDRVQTGLDRTQTGLDRAQATADAGQTAADRVQTGLDRTQTVADAAQTAADRVQTVADAAATAADRITVAADRATTVAAKDAAMVAFANFQDVYMGPFASDPTLDIDGSALDGGELYFNTTTNVMKVYTSSAWVAAYVSAAGVLLTANDLSDLNSPTAALTNLGLSANAKAFVTAANYVAMRAALGLGTAATTAATAYATSAQGAKADSALQAANISAAADFAVDPTKLAARETIAAKLPFNLTKTGWTVNTFFNLPHGLAAAPKYVATSLKCIVANNGWSVGATMAVDLGNADAARGVQTTWDGTNVTGYADGLYIVKHDRTLVFIISPTQWDLIYTVFP